MRRLLPLLLCCLAALPARAELVVVANPRSGIERLSQDEIVNIYLGRYRLLASGIAAEPLDQAYESDARGRFYRLLVNKSLAEVNAYWSRLLFSGKTQPPLAVGNAEAALQQVAARPGVLAYVDRTQVDGRVRIVFEFGRPQP
jgi:hypothetical protein